MCFIPLSVYHTFLPSNVNSFSFGEKCLFNMPSSDMSYLLMKISGLAETNHALSLLPFHLENTAASHTKLAPPNSNKQRQQPTHHPQPRSHRLPQLTIQVCKIYEQPGRTVKVDRGGLWFILSGPWIGKG